MERIKARKDVVWKRVDGVELKLDVYAPPGGKPSKPLPAVVFIHGGPIPSNLRTEPKEWGVFISHGQLAAASGFVGVTFNHRLHQLKLKSQAVPPLFVARAGLDNPAINAALDRFAQEAMTRNVTIDIVNHAAGHHGFDALDNDDRTREIIRRTIEFIRARN
jgi:acetyl esterase/lipase